MSAIFAGPSTTVASPASTRRLDHRFLLWHALAVPAVFALLALLAQSSGLDERVASAFYDPLAGSFDARSWPLLETFGHRFAKSAIWALWLGLLASAVLARFVPRLAGESRALWLTVFAMALGPVIVVALKDLNAHHCPWDLKRYGGSADFTAAWFVRRTEAGRCFPSGHASAGFSLIAFAFAGRYLQQRRLQTLGVAAALLVGAAFSAIRTAQGAHFLSHNLMAAAVVWWAAAAVFAPALLWRHATAPAGAPAARGS
jgi:membrane-associated PAP2 superfamily phosphatase